MVNIQLISTFLMASQNSKIAGLTHIILSYHFGPQSTKYSESWTCCAVKPAPGVYA